MRITKRIYLVALIAQLFLMISSSYAQEFNKLFDLYEQNEVDELKARVEKLSPQYPGNNVLSFFSSLFTENAEQALQEYLKLFEKTEGRLKGYVADRLADYYYAHGYYVTSQRYAQQAKELMKLELQIEPATPIMPLSSTTEESSSFKIQVGAFGFRYNADQLLSMLETQNIVSEIVQRRVKGTNLYCVWVNGKNSYEETKNYAEILKRKYHLHYRIIEQ